MPIVRVGNAYDLGGSHRVQIDAGRDGSLIVLSTKAGAFLNRLEEDGSQTLVAPSTYYGNFSSGYVETLSDGRYALYTTFHFGLGDGSRVQVLNRDGTAATQIVDTMYEGQNRSGSGYTLTGTQDGGFAFVWNDTSRHADSFTLSYPPSNGHTQNPVYARSDVRVRFFDADAVATAPSTVADDDVETLNGATASRRAEDQYINDSEILAGGQTAFVYMDHRLVGSPGGGAHGEWEVSLQISSPGNVGEPIKVDLGPYNEQFGRDYPQAIDPSAGANIVALADGSFAVIWTENTYVAANVHGGYSHTGWQSVIRYFDASGAALTDAIPLVTRGLSHGNHSKYVFAEALPDGRIAIAYNVGQGGVNGNGSLDAFLGIVGPLGSSLEVSRVNPTAAANTQVYTISDLAVRTDGTIELVYNDAATDPAFQDGRNLNHTMIERFAAADTGALVRNGAATGETIAGTESADLIFANGGNDIVSGLGGADKVQGGEGDDSIEGGAGADRLLGGAGVDTLSYAASDAGVQVRLDTLSAVGGHAAGDQVQGFEHLTGSGFGDTLAGHDEANHIFGGAGVDALHGLGGNDTLSGGTGADFMAGNAGDDIYYVDDAGDQAIETSASDGVDQVSSSASFTLGNHVEQLTLTGSAAVNAVGNSLANLITGNSAANVLNGGAGGDTMTGGRGNDTYVVESSLDRVIERSGSGTDTVSSAINYTLGSYVERLTLTGSSALTGTGNMLANLITGNNASNRLNGGAGNDVLNGGGGHDVLDGGTGNDAMTGGTGNDTYLAGSIADRAIESSAGGIDTVWSAASYTLGLNVERLTLTGNSALTGTGNTLANLITGNGGSNRLNGGAGNDVLNGGGGHDVLDGGTGSDRMAGSTGNDLYVVGSALDRVTETSASHGIDTVLSGASYTLGLHVERLTLTGTSSLSGTGNAAANRITGNGGANSLNGAAGKDFLTGGAGADKFLFNTALSASTNWDDILDFSVRDDTIVLDRTVFTKILVNGTLSSAAFVTGRAAADSADRIVYDRGTGNIFYDADGTGAAAKILFAQVNAGTALTNADFVAIA